MFFIFKFSNVALCPQRPWHKDYYCIRDGEPGMATLTFTQLPSSDIFYSLKFSVALCPQRPYGLLGKQPRTDTVTFTQLLSSVLECCLMSTETVRTIRDRAPSTATSAFMQLLSCCLLLSCLLPVFTKEF